VLLQASKEFGHAAGEQAGIPNGCLVFGGWSRSLAEGKIFAVLLFKLLLSTQAPPTKHSSTHASTCPSHQVIRVSLTVPTLVCLRANLAAAPIPQRSTLGEITRQQQQQAGLAEASKQQRQEQQAGTGVVVLEDDMEDSGDENTAAAAAVAAAGTGKGRGAAVRVRAIIDDDDDD
jgi:hypothetical protein